MRNIFLSNLVLHGEAGQPRSLFCRSRRTILMTGTRSGTTRRIWREKRRGSLEEGRLVLGATQWTRVGALPKEEAPLAASMQALVFLGRNLQLRRRRMTKTTICSTTCFQDLKKTGESSRSNRKHWAAPKPPMQENQQEGRMDGAAWRNGVSLLPRTRLTN